MRIIIFEDAKFSFDIVKNIKGLMITGNVNLTLPKFSY
jgi:hypothetical protein